jgi:glycosyltransferase involved in cell wall biosynthesis
MLDAPHPDAIGSALHESDHVSCVWDEVDRAAEQGWAFDVLHDHSSYTGLAMASRLDIPVVHTMHLPLVGDTARFYTRHGHKANLVAISRSQAAGVPVGVHVTAVVPNPIAVDRWPLREVKDDYLLWIGRMDPVKGAHRAIGAARLAGRPLVIAGPVQAAQAGQSDYFHERVEPYIDGRRVSYVGEVGGVVKQELIAHAKALLMPIRWDEPFGMVMVEALACGTPVIGFAEGAATEIVIHGENGMLVGDEAEMAHATRHLDAIDPLRCRRSVADRYDTAIIASSYEAVYQQAARAGHSHEARRLLDSQRRGAGGNGGDSSPLVPAPGHKLAPGWLVPAGNDPSVARETVKV